MEVGNTSVVPSWCTVFAFIGCQRRLTLDGDHFYHVKLKSCVILDLKSENQRCEAIVLKKKKGTGH